MKQIILFSVIIGCSTLSSCQKESNNYDIFLNSWIGQSEAQLVTTWGAPIDIQNSADNKQTFTYISEKKIIKNGISYDYFCQTTFTTQNDIITDYSWSGQGCLIK